MILILNQLLFSDFDFKSSEISLILILKSIQNQNLFMISYYYILFNNIIQLSYPDKLLIMNEHFLIHSLPYEGILYGENYIDNFLANKNFFK